MPERYPYDPNIHITAPRFSLTANSRVANDWLERRRYGADRYVSYMSSGDDARMSALKKLQTEGLILGEQVDSRQFNLRVHRVPVTSRPVLYEARVASHGNLTLDDATMVKEIGRLSGAVNRLTGGAIIGGRAAEEAFALTDFVKQDERQVFLVPGTEELLVQPHDEAMIAQMQQFSEHFGHRFGEFADHFITGYQAGLAKV